MSGTWQQLRKEDWDAAESGRSDASVCPEWGGDGSVHGSVSYCNKHLNVNIHHLVLCNTQRP